MANAGDTASSPQDTGDSSAVNQAILQSNYQAYVNNGGDPNNYVVGPGMTFSKGPPKPPAVDPSLLYGSQTGSARYAPYDVGNGMTKWDEFVQQMQLEQNKLKQAQDIETSRLSQEKQLAEEKLQEEQKIADQNTVEAFTKNLTGMQGPKDPYGYLFASRGLAPPQGYSPTALPLPQAVVDSYKNQGVDLASAQQAVSGSSGPSFINGYLGGMPNNLQTGPMGFQNAPQQSNTSTNIQTQPTTQNAPSSGQTSNAIQGQAPIGMATGGVVPGFAPGSDTVPAVLSPGEGILKPQAVQAMGGPSVIDQLNSGYPTSSVQNGQVQRFANGGNVMPLQTSLAPTGNFDNNIYSYFRATPGQTVQDAANFFANNTGTQGTTANEVGRLNYFNPSPRLDAAGNTFYYLPNNLSGYQPGDAQKWQALMYSGALPTGTQSFLPGMSQPVGQATSEPTLGAGLSPVSPGVTMQGSSPLLTGGSLAPVGPANGPPMNLNMLDPYTRSLTDQYGVPQIPSAQALASMPQSGLDAYKNYVETVAGGNFQDLLDQSKNLNPQGALAGDLKFS